MVAGGVIQQLQHRHHQRHLPGVEIPRGGAEPGPDPRLLEGGEVEAAGGLDAPHQDDKIPAPAGPEGTGPFVIDHFPPGNHPGDYPGEGLRLGGPEGDRLLLIALGEALPVQQLQGDGRLPFRQRRVVVRPAVERFVLAVAGVAHLPGHDAGEEVVDRPGHLGAGAEVFGEGDEGWEVFPIVGGKGVLFLEEDGRVGAAEAVDALL